LNFIWDKITEWLKEVLAGGVKDNLMGLFGTLNDRIDDIATQVGMTPQAWDVCCKGWL